MSTTVKSASPQKMIMSVFDLLSINFRIDSLIPIVFSIWSALNLTFFMISYYDYKP